MAIEEETNTENEDFQLLKDEADMMGISYSPNIGFETLRERVNAKKLAGKTEVTSLSKEERIRQAAYLEAHKLVRCVIACLNPSKQSLTSEHMIVSGEYFGTIKRQVPLGSSTSEGWHIENAIYQHMKDKKFTKIETRKNESGRDEQRAYSVPEYTIVVLPPLTEEELDKLKRRQNVREHGLKDLSE